MKKPLSFVLILTGLFIFGCSKLNDNPPDYVKDGAAYKEGIEGLMIYFILADASGAMTTSEGKVSLTISEAHSKWFSWSFEFIETELYSMSFNVKKTDFRKAKMGIGASEREVILCPIGRIVYSSFSRKPSEMTGKVKMIFQRPDGRILKGEERVFF